VWARERIAELSRRLVRAADPALQQEVLALALEHRLLTPYTAFVAVDESAATAGGAPRRVVVPVEVPDAAREIMAGGGGGGWYASPGVQWSSAYEGNGIGHGHFVERGHGDGLPVLSDDVVRQINASRVHVPVRPPPRPRFTIPAPTVVGGELDEAIVRRYVRRKETQLAYCYEREVLASPTLGGTLRASFIINLGGNVSDATASGVGNAKVEACIVEVLKSIEFPRPDGGPVRVTYAFVLTPG